MEQPRLLLSLGCLSVLFLCCMAASQIQPTRPIPAADSKLIEIKVTGSKRFDQEQIAAASGLQLGTTVDDEVFRKAARQLGESGAFDGISYSFTYSSAGTKLTFQVTNAEKFVPAHFADFVWFPRKRSSAENSRARPALRWRTPRLRPPNRSSL